MKFALIDKVSKVAAKGKYVLKVKSPQIKVGIGIGLGVATVVLACRATAKSKDHFDKLAEQEQENRKEYGNDKKELRKAQTEVAVNCVKKTWKYWAGPIACGAGSIALILNGMGELNSRYVGAVATAGAFQKAFAGYRQKVAEKIGTDEEQNLYRGIEYKDVKVEDKDGKEKTLKKAPVVSNELACNPMTVAWQDYDPATKTGSDMWDTRNDKNLLLIRNVQDQANRKLQLNGFLTLGEVLQMLHMKPQSLLDPMMALNWGWVYTKNNDDRNSDNYVDFGVWDAYWNHINEDAYEYGMYKRKDLFLEFNAVPLFGIADYQENKLSAYLSQR